MGLQSRPIQRSETVEVNINNLSSQEFKFSDNEISLDKVRLTGIIVHTESVGTTVQGKTVVPNAIQKRAFLTLASVGNDQRIKRIPLETFFNDQKFMLELDSIPVDVAKSKIELSDRTGATTDMAFLITFFFEPI